MIIVNVGAPTTALSNRYYTDSFFHQAKTSLNENGVLALCHFPAGEHFLGEELLALNKIVLNTLQYEFSNVLALPGDNAIYFASNSEMLSSSLPELEQRFLNRNPVFQYFDVSMLTYIYQQSRIDDFTALLNSSTEKGINNDIKPVSYLFDFLIWHKIVRGENKIIRAIVSTNLKTLLLLLAVALFVICVFLLIFSNKKIKLMRIRMAAAIIGLAGMVCNIILLLSFQTLFGYIYTWVGLAMAAYMAGTAGASLLIVNMMPADKARSVLVGLFLITITILLLLLPIIRILANLASPILYIFLFMMAGALIGAAFPLLCRLFSTISGNMELGRIYAADVLGGAVGAFFVSSFLAPLYGFFNTLIMTAFLCMAGLVLVVVHKK
jgi:spermidine synthase